ncbi:MAG: nitroreductase family protein [Bacteroidetes bacterium]|nr:nitroreductase family protein [Bacteroidota bacterium]
MNPVFKRRSIRKFTGEPVSSEHIEELLKAGLCAPSARNTQSWHFIAVTERHLLDEIPSFHPYAAMCKEVTLAILVCGDLAQENNTGYLVQNCSAATENILVTAAHLGLGSVWLGVYAREERMKGMKNLFKLPDHILPVALIAIGHPAEEKPPKSDYDWSKVKFNRW